MSITPSGIFKLGVAWIVFCALVGIAGTIGIGYVIFHFVSKLW